MWRSPRLERRIGLVRCAPGGAAAAPPLAPARALAASDRRRRLRPRPRSSPTPRAAGRSRVVGAALLAAALLADELRAAGRGRSTLPPAVGALASAVLADVAVQTSPMADGGAGTSSRSARLLPSPRPSSCAASSSATSRPPLGPPPSSARSPPPRCSTAPRWSPPGRRRPRSWLAPPGRREQRFFAGPAGTPAIALVRHTHARGAARAPLRRWPRPAGAALAVLAVAALAVAAAPAAPRTSRRLASPLSRRPPRRLRGVDRDPRLTAGARHGAEDAFRTGTRW